MGKQPVEAILRSHEQPREAAGCRHNATECFVTGEVTQDTKMGAAHLATDGMQVEEVILQCTSTNIWAHLSHFGIERLDGGHAAGDAKPH